eukprot:363670-Chlamydomonas_euryale.AAC.22
MWLAAARLQLATCQFAPACVSPGTCHVTRDAFGRPTASTASAAPAPPHTTNSSGSKTHRQRIP